MKINFNKIKKIIIYSLSTILISGTVFTYGECFNDTETLPEPVIYSNAAILMDGKTGEILFEKNADEKHYPASITKVMTALLTLEHLKKDDTFVFSQNAIYSIEAGSSHIGMKIGEKMTVDQALHALLLMSANEVANGLAEAVSGTIDQFAIDMTNRAKMLGAKNTNFVNPHGLHNENHYTTAHDMALIVKELYKNDYFKEIMSHETYQIPANELNPEIRYLSQQHKLMNSIRYKDSYREDVIAGKTGYTNEARHTLVTVASKNNIDLIVVILEGEKNSYYEDTEKLLDFGYSNYKDINKGQKIDFPDIPIYTVRSGKIKDLGSVSISIVGDNSFFVSKKIATSSVDTKYTLPEFIEENSKEGDIVGSLEYINDGKVIFSQELCIEKIKTK